MSNIRGALHVALNADTEAHLDAMLGPPRTFAHTLDAPTNGPALGTDPRPAARLSWSMRDWEKKDAKGLLALKDQHPNVYRQLFLTQYGAEPKGLNLATPAALAAGAPDAVTAARLSAADRQSWSMRDWEKKDPEGLAAIRKHAPARYQQMFDAQYGGTKG